MVAYGQLELS